MSNHTKSILKAAKAALEKCESEIDAIKDLSASVTADYVLSTVTRTISGLIDDVRRELIDEDK